MNGQRRLPSLGFTAHDHEHGHESDHVRWPEAGSRLNPIHPYYRGPHSHAHTHQGSEPDHHAGEHDGTERLESVEEFEHRMAYQDGQL